MWLLEMLKRTFVKLKERKTHEGESEVNATQTQLLILEAKSQIRQKETQIYESIQY